MNLTILKGNLTRDPEMRYTPKGTAIAAFGIGINRKWTTEDGTAKEEVSFFDIEAWGRTAETIAQWFKKGQPILIQGRLKQDSWTDKQSDEKRYKIKIVLEHFEFCGESKGSSGDAPAQPATPRSTRPASAPTAQTDANQLPPDDNDVPF
jgi:single-strand DNA-binding protein